MGMRSKEDILKEQRTIEAVRKGLMSGNGKLGVIARVLGDRVVARHGNHHSVSPVFENMFGFGQNFMDGSDDEDDEGQLPTMEEGDGERHTASLFNGYSRGLHLEIKLDGPEICVRWKGEIVFHEMSGELLAFCPGEWEQTTDKLCIEARRKEVNFINLADQRSEIIGQRRKDAFIDEMRKKWGLK